MVSDGFCKTNPTAGRNEVPDGTTKSLYELEVLLPTIYPNPAIVTRNIQ